MSIQTSCPGCGGLDVRLAPASRQTGRVVARCRACGCHWLSNPPASEQTADNQSYDRAVYQSYVDAKRSHALLPAYRGTLQRIGQLIESGGRDLFDVGAGAGEFLTLAQEAGFIPHGNELAPGAIEMAKESSGISLHFGDLSTIEGKDLYDALTMWCVLAHVDNPDALLGDALRVLKPGGVLFLQTPRWSAMDTMALAAARSSCGRVVRVLDRRVNDYHMTLNSVAGLSAQARRQGFEIIEVRARARYSMQTDTYLRQLGLPARLCRPAARALDALVDQDLVFRNVLDLLARKPLARKGVPSGQ